MKILQKSIHLINLILSTLLISCGSEDPQIDTTPDEPEEICGKQGFFDDQTQRNFKMGFSTWSYGPTANQKRDTYNFIAAFADIYSEQVDDKIPWQALINNRDLPEEFTNDIEQRRLDRPQNKELLLSVSLFNTDRNELAADLDGTVPFYFALTDDAIENAYYKHLQYLVDTLDPDYLVMAMEVNDLLIKSETKWNEYLDLSSNIQSRLKNEYPNLKLSASITLHNLFQPDVTNPDEYITEIGNYINQFDFAAISHYPFFLNHHTTTEFQSTFDFLHNHINIPIALVETAHLAEDLTVDGFNLFITGEPCEQNAYLETVITNAQQQNYEFIIWWTHRDYDALWETFPPEVQDIGKLWRDTGLLDENGNARPGFSTWRKVLWK